MSRQFGGFNHNRQQERARMLLFLGLVLLVVVAGGAAFVLTYGAAPVGDGTATTVVVQKEPDELRQVDVLVPLKPIDAGVQLEPRLFNVEKRPELGLSPRAVRSFEDIRGMYARSMIVQGEPLLTDFVTSVRPTNPVTANIPEGYRAVTISVNATSSVEGWALPGARVDIVWASQIRGRPGVTVIVQNAKIISAERVLDPNAKPGAPTPSTVTLLVTVEDATKIQLAASTGALNLALRGDADPGKGISGSSITVDDLLGGVKGELLKKPVGPTVKVRGTDGKQEELVLEGGKLVPLPQTLEEVKP